MVVRLTLVATCNIALFAAGCAHNAAVTTPAPTAPADPAPTEPAPTELAPADGNGDPGAPAGGGDAAEVPFEVPRFERIDIGTTGMSAYLPKGFPAFDVADSPDGSRVHSGEIGVGGFGFGCIALRFKDPLGPDDDSEALLTGYLDFLKGEFKVKQAAGYGRGHTLDSEPRAHGIIDYWVDQDGVHYELEGWVTPTHLAVL